MPQNSFCHGKRKENYLDLRKSACMTYLGFINLMTYVSLRDRATAKRNAAYVSKRVARWITIYWSLPCPVLKYTTRCIRDSLSFTFTGSANVKHGWSVAIALAPSSDLERSSDVESKRSS